MVLGRFDVRSIDRDDDVRVMNAQPPEWTQMTNRKVLRVFTRRPQLLRCWDKMMIKCGIAVLRYRVQSPIAVSGFVRSFWQQSYCVWWKDAMRLNRKAAEAATSRLWVPLVSGCNIGGVPAVVVAIWASTERSEHEILLVSTLARSRWRR